MTDHPALPPSIHAELDAAFRIGPLISEAAAARVIGFSADSLRREREDGKISYRLRRKRRVYAREDIEAYLAEDRQCQSTGPSARTARSNRRITSSISRSPSTANVVAFTDRRGSELLERLKNSKRGNAARRSAADPTTISH